MEFAFSETGGGSSIIRFLYEFANFTAMAKTGKNIDNIWHMACIDFQFTGSKQIFASLQTHIIPGKTYLLALSGGSDSMLTVSLVYKYFIQQKLGLQNLILVHCNHWVRTESYQESKFLEKFFAGTNFHIVTRRENLQKINEENLRKRRYNEFAKLAKKYHASTLIVGHNLTDRIESTLLHLLRGAHLKWFLAMTEYEKHHLFPGNIYRPILNISKDAVLKICQKYKIPYSTDKSNFDSKTSLRNKLRMEVLPWLYKLANKARHRKLNSSLKSVNGAAPRKQSNNDKHAFYGESQTENSFQQSMLHIYEELEKTTEKKTFHLTSFTACSLWKAKFAYEVSSTSQSRTDETTVQVLRELKITHDMSIAQIRELTKFFSTAEQWFKYLQWTYFFVAHRKVYAILAPPDFWQKTVEKSKKIATLWQVKRYNFTLPIVKTERIGWSVRFAKASDHYHNKTRNQYCITAKIPVFWRNFVPVVVKGEKIVNVFREMI